MLLSSKLFTSIGWFVQQLVSFFYISTFNLLNKLFRGSIKYGSWGAELVGMSINALLDF